MKTLRRAFAERLAVIAESKGFKERGRQAEVARVCQVTQPAAKKWFDGDALPGMDHCVTIAEWGNVSFEWLITGRGPKRPGDLYQTPAIAHVVETMLTMEPDKQYLVSRITDEIAEAKKAPPGGGTTEHPTPEAHEAELL